MIKSRKEILDMNSCLAQHLISLQTAKHKPSSEWKDGDSLILNNSNKTTVLTKEQADTLNAKELHYFLDNKDDYEPQNLNKWVGRVTLISSKKESHDYLNDISKSFVNLSKQYGRFIIVGDWTTPWLHQKNEYLPVLEASTYLNSMVENDFNGGFVLEGNKISEFIPHLFWLTRCNASLPEFMISFESSKTVFGVCKYGVLHLEFYNTEERKEILNIFNEMKFKEVNQCNDSVDFDNMDERKIIN